MARPLRISRVPHYLALVRAGLGLTQTQLATVLGVSRQFITQVEASQRPLPLAAGHRLHWLTQALPTAPLPPAPVADAAPLRARAAAVAYEVGQLSRRLARGQERAARAVRWLRAAPQLLATLPPAAEGERQWIAAITAEAEAALLGEGSPARHQLLAARLAGLQAEAAALAAYATTAPPAAG